MFSTEQQHSSGIKTLEHVHTQKYNMQTRW